MAHSEKSLKLVDEVISEETSTLAIQKGFDRDEVQEPINIPGIGTHWPGITQSLLKRWLREVHNLHIEVCTRDHVEKPMYYYNIFGKYKDLSLIVCIRNGPHEKYETYELALEDALKESLNLIENA